MPAHFEVEWDMNLDQRQTTLIQTPVGRSLPPLPSGEMPSGVGGLGESADRRMAGLPGNVALQPNEMHGLKETSGLGDTQVARVDNLKDGKLPGLNRLMELSAECDEASKPATWRDNLMVPESLPPNVRNMAVGISGGAVAGVLVCVLALHLMRNSTANHSPEPIPPGHQATQPVTTTDVKVQGADVKVQKTVETKPAGEMHANSGDFLATADRSELPKESTPTTRLRSRLDPKVLYRLELSLEQAARVRTILDRCSKDSPFAEAQIRGLLTEEQDRRWQSIAP